jgi:diacylglycerol kinase
MKHRTFSWKSRGGSLRFAWEGLRRFFAEEHNAWIHLGATVAVVMAALLFHVSREETLALIIVSGLVWVAEIFNTAIEKVMDFISPAHHEATKYIKDLAAAGVLVTSLIALVTGCIVFIPKCI